MNYNNTKYKYKKLETNKSKSMEAYLIRYNVKMGVKF